MIGRLPAQQLLFGCRVTWYDIDVNRFHRQDFLERAAVAFDFESLGIHQLSVGERLLLIEQIWDSLPEQVDARDVPEWHQAELARRRSLVGPDSAPGKPWREVLSSLEDGR